MIVNGKWKIDLGAPHQVYKNSNRKRLPGVTTICGVFDKPALKRWGLGMERDSILRLMESSTSTSAHDLIEEILAGLPPKNDKGDPTYFCEQFTERAADIGTVAHARCEAFLHGVELDEEGLDAELVDKSTNAFVRFHDWWTERGLTVLHSELQMVSEAWQVGGTADIIARRHDGALILVDLKTTKASRWWPYPETFAQVMAYAEMYREISTNWIEEVTIVRIGKEEDDPGQTYTLNENERLRGLELFNAARVAYNARKELSRG